jgi:hypothetical protein
MLVWFAVLGLLGVWGIVQLQRRAVERVIGIYQN